MISRTRLLKFISLYLISNWLNCLQQRVHSKVLRIRSKLSNLRLQRLILLRRRRRLSRILVYHIYKRNQRTTDRRAWMLPRPQFWFNEILNNTGYDDVVWRENFRVSRATFEYIVQLVDAELSRRDTPFRNAVPIEKRVAVSLWRLATGDSYRACGLQFGLPKSTTSMITHEFCSILTRKMDEFIKFPYSRAEVRKAIDEFQNISEFPQVIGAVDGSHIPIKKPKDSPNAYYNRKSFHSVILQGVCDANYKFTDVSTGYPGRMHDARVFRISRIGNELINGQFPNDPVDRIGQIDVPPMLLGDPAYALRPNLMKAYPEGTCTQAERNFNRKLSSTRVVIEQAFGLLKGRWRCLDSVNEDDMSTVSETIIACCILHNICQTRGEEYDGMLGQVIHINNGQPPAGGAGAHVVRDAIKDFLY